MNVAACRRLGTPATGRIQRLLVTAETAEQAAAVIDAARKLRHSPKPEVRDGVFINPDMTPAEQHAAYELRCRRRQANQRTQGSRRQISTQQPNSAAMSTENNAADTVCAAGDRADLNRSDVTPAVVAVATVDRAMDVSRVSTTAIASTTATASCVQSTGTPSVLSLSAPVFVPFVPPAPVTGEGSQPSGGAGRPGDGLVQQ